jgi:hypothetical protein
MNYLGNAMWIAAAAAILAAPATATAADPGATLIDRPTVRSEMARGIRVALVCDGRGQGGGFLVWSKCQDEAVTTNELSNSVDDAAFQMGLYFQAWVQAGWAIRSPSPADANVLPDLRRRRQDFWVDFHGLAAELSLQDGDILKLAKSDKDVIVEYAKWTADPSISCPPKAIACVGIGGRGKFQ